EHTPPPGNHAVAPPGGEAPREHLEHGSAMGGAVGQGGLQHRELVAVGEQRRRHGGHRITTGARRAHSVSNVTSTGRWSEACVSGTSTSSTVSSGLRNT